MRVFNRLACSLVVAAVALVGGLVSVAPASAASPWWRLASYERPDAIEPEGTGKLVLTVANLGNAAADGSASPIAITDVVPAGLKPLSVEATAGEHEGLTASRGPVACPTGALTQTITCTFAGTYSREGVTTPKTLPPYDQIEMTITVEAQPGAKSGEANELTVAGGGAPGASLGHPIRIGRTPSFGVEQWELTPEEEGGAPATQAGKHPYQVTGSFTVNQNELAEAVALPKELNSKLPPGLIGNPTPLPQCTLGQFLTITNFEEDQCPAQTAVGVAMVTVNERTHLGIDTFTVPIFNVEPAVGEAARFGFYVPGTPVLLDPSVRTGGDYGITLGSTDISQTAALMQFKLTFWGVPGDPSHDNSRGTGCLEHSRQLVTTTPCAPLEARNPPPFLSLPTSCSGPLHATLEAASWKEPARKLFFEAEPMQALDGCNRLSFAASIKVTPDGTAAESPTGLSVDVHVPQDSVTVANGLAQSNIRSIAVTLPAGVRLNPSAADGLQACPESLIGYLPGESSPPGDLRFTEKLPEALLPGIDFCPDASKVATVRISSPLLPKGQTLNGAVYLASPAPDGEAGQNPFDTTVAMYVEAFDPVSGTLVKLPGKVSLDQETGQISASFENTPQLAFEDAEIHFFGGERAPLATPSRCGSYTTEATFTPWSGNPPIKSSSTFQITTGPHGSACPGSSLPFAPSLTGGSTNIQAGAFSPFTTTMSRQDGQQALQGVVLHMPPGLSGLLTGVKLCGEAEGNAGTCGPESLIGETIVSVGVGGSPFSVEGGRVYITGPYHGAPFGLSIVNPAKAGPFDLEKSTPCDCVVVRAKIEVDPVTAALTVTTDDTGPYRIPTILDGIPLQIQHVNVTVARPGFTFNPTNCSPMAITGAIQSTEGASGPVSVPFQVTNCATLGFKPSFSVSTSGKTSKRTGASLHVKLTYPNAPFGSQANIKSVKVELPRQLPSNLKALQHACPHQTFEANPAACPSISAVGHATATTPLLPVPLSGPAYFVSYGGAQFPELVIVLQGYGITLDLHGETFIDEHTNVTSSTFKTVPDAPVGSFELSLPQGEFSALAANTNLCAVPGGLKMPTRFVAQNGAELTQSTPISVSGCAPAIRVLGKRVKNGVATLTVSVPAAGRLHASGAGLTGATKRVGRAGTTTISVALSASERRFLAGHRGRKLKAHVRLVFTPARGKALRASATVLIG